MASEASMKEDKTFEELLSDSVAEAWPHLASKRAPMFM